MKEKHFSFKVLSFYIAFALITIIFLVVFGMRIFKVSTFNDLNDVKRAGLMINGQITTKKEDSYYVYIYSSKAHNSNYAYAEVEPTIFTYFTYVSKNGGSATRIYAYDVDTFTQNESFANVNEYLESLSTNLKTSELPALVLVSSGGVSNTFTTINKINSELQNIMTTK